MFINKQKTRASAWWLYALLEGERNTCNEKMRVYNFFLLPTLVAARSKAWACDRSLAGTAGTNPPEIMDICLFWMSCDVRNLCIGPITHPEKPYRLWCVWVISKSQQLGGRGSLGLLKLGNRYNFFKDKRPDCILVFYDLVIILHISDKITWLHAVKGIKVSSILKGKLKCLLWKS
jgi:hypothetical protein